MPDSHYYSTGFADESFIGVLSTNRLQETQAVSPDGQDRIGVARN
jgi:hypothetical protein